MNHEPRTFKTNVEHGDGGIGAGREASVKFEKGV